MPSRKHCAHPGCHRKIKRPSNRSGWVGGDNRHDLCREHNRSLLDAAHAEDLKNGTSTRVHWTDLVVHRPLRRAPGVRKPRTTDKLREDLRRLIAA